MHDLIRTLTDYHILPVLLVLGTVLIVIDYFYETDIPCQVGYFCFGAAMFFALPLSVLYSLIVAIGIWMLLVILHVAWFKRFLN